jgi:hypothetical protein
MRLQLRVRGNEICSTENRNEFRPATLALLSLRCLEELAQFHPERTLRGDAARLPGQSADDRHCRTANETAQEPAPVNFGRVRRASLGNVSPDSFRRFRADAVNCFQPAAFDELSQIVERSNLKLLMEQCGRLGPNARQLQQIEYCFGRFRGQAIPCVKGAFFQQFDDLAGDCLPHTRNFQQAGHALVRSDPVHFCRPCFNGFRRHPIRTEAKWIFAANFHQRSHAIEALGDFLVGHRQCVGSPRVSQGADGRASTSIVNRVQQIRKTDWAEVSPRGNSLSHARERESAIGAGQSTRILSLIGLRPNSIADEVEEFARSHNAVMVNVGGAL